MTRLAQTIVAALAALAATVLFAAPADAASALYTNPTPIAIPEKGTASPYPSQIDVQGLPGRITEIVVGLRQFSHTAAQDVDILLVSPDGKTSIVMSDACDGRRSDLMFSIFQRRRRP